jgi:hypothetical protein
MLSESQDLPVEQIIFILNRSLFWLSDR